MGYCMCVDELSNGFNVGVREGTYGGNICALVNEQSELLCFWGVKK